MKKIFIMLTFLYTVLLMPGCSSENAAGGGLSVNGTVETGECLTLAHNQGRDDIAFTAQFVKENYIYSYDRYTDYFGGGLASVVEPTDFKNGGFNSSAVATLENGDVVLAYTADSYESPRQYGAFLILGPTGYYVAGPVYFNSSATYHLKVKTLQNGNFVIVYQYS